jgi:hypothetical protein
LKSDSGPVFGFGRYPDWKLGTGNWELEEPWLGYDPASSFEFRDASGLSLLQVKNVA